MTEEKTENGFKIKKSTFNKAVSISFEAIFNIRIILYFRLKMYKYYKSELVVKSHKNIINQNSNLS